MAQFSFEISKEFQKQLEKASNLEKIAPKMLEAGGKVYEKHIKKNIKKSIGSSTKHKSKSTGDLLHSIKMSKPKLAKTGAYITMTMFAGKGKNGTHNAIKAAELEYGNSHQKATPFVASANKDAEKEAINVMQEVYNQEASK